MDDTTNTQTLTNPTPPQPGGTPVPVAQTQSILPNPVSETVEPSLPTLPPEPIVSPEPTIAPEPTEYMDPIAPSSLQEESLQAISTGEKKGIIKYIIIAFVVLALIGGGAFAYFTLMANGTDNKTLEPTQTAPVVVKDAPDTSVFSDLDADITEIDNTLDKLEADLDEDFELTTEIPTF